MVCSSLLFCVLCNGFLVLLMRETAEEARAMLQGVGSRFDFHMNKTLCDLRSGCFSSSNLCGSESRFVQNKGNL